jgi:hypothetical protein
MIWLSANAGTEERSVYFDIRDIDLQCTGSAVSGLVRGIVGDGQCEYWGEVCLGEDPQVKILPFWEEEQEAAEIENQLDLQMLKVRLAGTVAGIFHGIGQLATVGSLQNEHRSFIELWPAEAVAA